MYDDIMVRKKELTILNSSMRSSMLYLQSYVEDSNE